MNDPLRHYRDIWLVDFEFGSATGERPQPLCMVAREFRTGRTLRMWRDELAEWDRAPFGTGPDSLFVAYFASAEFGCFLALGWPTPLRILDLFVEFRSLSNGRSMPHGNGLLGALQAFGLDSMAAARKSDMRELALRGGGYTSQEKTALLDYCESDVAALAKLLPTMLPRIDFPRALLRGRYTTAIARMEWTGTPIDVGILDRLRGNWDTIRGRLIERVDADFGVYVPADQSDLDPNSPLGSAILNAANEWDIDVHDLRDAVDFVWRNGRAEHIEREKARALARKTTRLTRHRITKWENDGYDHSTYPMLDEQARELAAEFPALGLGTGYRLEEGFDGTDYAAALWENLREPARPAPARHDPDIIRRAAELAANGEGTGRYSGPLRFSSRRFAEYLAKHNLPWPRLPSGELALDDQTFRDMAKAYPQIAPLRELRYTLGQLRLESLAVGSDGRNRCLLSPFGAKSSRNTPSNAKFIFGPSCWLRGLIRPEPGRAMAYVDYSQQEFAIAAKLSGDTAMMAAYRSGDPYLAFAKQAGAVPEDATRQSHKQVRDLFKTCALGVQYGMAERSLAARIGQPTIVGRKLLEAHRRTYPRFWRWSQAAMDHATLHRSIHTVFGWTLKAGDDPNPRTFANFPMQGNGAEMLRLACCLATERGIEVCAPIHDALLVEGPADGIGDVVHNTQAAMAEASRVVLEGFEVRTDAKVVMHPERYMDERGERMWESIIGILSELEIVYAADTSPEVLTY